MANELFISFIFSFWNNLLVVKVLWLVVFQTGGQTHQNIAGMSHVLAVIRLIGSNKSSFFH